MPRISVIVTTFNRKELLAETINSILNQTYQDFELIVVDNFSCYNFFDHIKSFNSDKIIPFQNNNNGIIAVNRNFGISNSKGEFLAFCDDDDIWSPNKLKIQLQILEVNSSDFVFSKIHLLKNDGCHQLKNFKPTNTLNRLLFSNHITYSSVMVRRSYNVTFNIESRLVGLEDYELWINLLLKGVKFQYLDIPLVMYRVSCSSYSRFSKSNNERKILTYKIYLLKTHSLLTIKNRIYLLLSILIRATRYILFEILKR